MPKCPSALQQLREAYATLRQEQLEKPRPLLQEAPMSREICVSGLTYLTSGDQEPGAGA